jgi:hypothetical protein
MDEDLGAAEDLNLAWDVGVGKVEETTEENG